MKGRRRKEYRNKERAIQTNSIKEGDIGLMTIEYGRLSERQLEASRKVMRRGMAKNGKIWLRVGATKGVTEKPKEVRMGKGKGSVSHKVAIVRPGQLIFEVKGGMGVRGVRVDFEKEMRKAAKKLPLKMKVVSRMFK